MSHEEWVLHRNFENVMHLLEYIENRVLDKDYKTGEYMYEALVELGKHIGQELDKLHN